MVLYSMMLDLRRISTDKLRTAWEEDFNLLLCMSLLNSKRYKGLIFQKQNDVSSSSSSSFRVFEAGWLYDSFPFLYTVLCVFIEHCEIL